MDWQPIETAPKDRRILLYYPQVQRIVVGKWLNPRPYRPYWTCDIEGLRGIRWHRANSPTHWVELLPPAG